MRKTDRKDLYFPELEILDDFYCHCHIYSLYEPKTARNVLIAWNSIENWNALLDPTKIQVYGNINQI